MLKSPRYLIFTQIPKNWPIFEKVQYFSQFLTNLDEIFTDKSWLPNQCVKLISVHFYHVLEVLEALRFEGFKVFSFFIVAHELEVQIRFLNFVNNFDNMVDNCWKLHQIGKRNGWDISIWKRNASCGGPCSLNMQENNRIF